MTISEEIFKILNEIRGFKDLLDMNTASDKLNDLSVWHASLTSHIAKKQNDYNKKLDNLLEENPKWSVRRAEIKAKAGEEYFELDKAIKLEKSLIEGIRSLKIWIKVRTSESETAYNL